MKPIEERFWELVEVGDPEGCWEWAGYKSKKGYGQLPVAFRHRRAHRMAFELSGGKLEEGEVVCHACDNPGCCNPKHLFAGTQIDNVNDRHKKNRDAKEVRLIKPQYLRVKSVRIHPQESTDTFALIAEKKPDAVNILGGMVITANTKES